MFVQAVPRAAVPPRSPSGTIIPVHARSADWAAWWTAPTHLLFPAGPAVPQGPRRATSNRALRRARIHIQWVVVLIVPDKRIRQSFTSRLLRSSKTKGQSESALFSFLIWCTGLTLVVGQTLWAVALLRQRNIAASARRGIAEPQASMAAG